jgi:hypothetical protein
MTFNVQKMISAINKSGVAKTSHFEVQCTGPGDPSEEESLMIRTDAVEIPGRSLMTAEHKFSNYGPINKVPYGGQVYGDVTLTVTMSQDMREKEYFEIWQDKITNTGAFEDGFLSSRFEKYVASKFNTNYFDSYIGVVTIRQYGSNGELHSIHTLQEAYPIIISPISMSWGQDDIAKINVTFAYRNYKAIFNKRDQPTLGTQGAFRIGTDGTIAGNVRIPGIGSIGGTTLGGGFKAVQAKIGQNSPFTLLRNF